MLLRFLALEHHAACFEREEVRRSRPVGCVSPPMCKHAVWMFSPGRPVSGPVETPAHGETCCCRQRHPLVPAWRSRVKQGWAAGTGRQVLTVALLAQLNEKAIESMGVK